MPTRIDGELFAAAKAVGALHSRSGAQQLAHWARIGRQLESSTSTRHDEIDAVLAGETSYDGLDDRQQAVVRGTWDAAIADRLDSLDLVRQFRGSGASWVEADDDGRVVSSSSGY